jgi:hypothetical protein
MHNLRPKFDKILTIVKQSLKNVIDEHGNVLKPGLKPKFSDAEVITLSLLSECLMFDSENYLFKMLHKNHPSDFPSLIERSRYNRRRRRLAPFKEQVRQYLVEHLAEGEDTFIVDSMPIPICQFSRAKRSKVCRENYQTAPSYGYCSAQNSTYFGYKLHGVSTVNGIITHFDLSKAKMHDIEYLQDIRDHYAGCLLLGDRAFLSESLQLELFETNDLLLKSPMRINQKNYKRQPTVFQKVRKRIETIFSQFCDQFRIQKNYAKSFGGFATRILAKITGFTLLQFLNKYEFNTHLNHVKHALI